MIPLTLTSMKLTWDPPQNFSRCVQSYVAQFIHGTESTNSSTNNVTIIIATGLTQGVHYAITVAARDGQGRTGQESEQVFYTLDGKQNNLKCKIQDVIYICLSFSCCREHYNVFTALKWNTFSHTYSLDCGML